MGERNEKEEREKGTLGERNREGQTDWDRKRREGKDRLGGRKEEKIERRGERVVGH